MTLGTISPSVSRTAKFVLQPKGCIHKEELDVTVLYKDYEWNKHIEQMRPKEVHCVCLFLKEKSIARNEKNRKRKIDRKVLHMQKEKKEQEKQKAKAEQEHVAKKKSEIRTNAFMLVFVFGAIMAFVFGAMIMGFSVHNDYTLEKSTPYPFPNPSAGQKTYTNSIGMEFVLIPAGSFDMGSPSNDEDRHDSEEPVHKVKIPDGFYLGKYEVTQKQWHEVMKYNTSYYEGDDRPVEAVSWNDVQDFVRKLNHKEGTNKYRLPSEAEWEYVARAGTTTRYSFGDIESNLGEYAWYGGHDGNSGDETHPVGQKKPNPWGLYDMHGNVEEWVQDEWHNSYNGAPTDGSVWEDKDDSDRVIRGGSWRSHALNCRSVDRYYLDPDYSNYVVVGFRLLRIP